MDEEDELLYGSSEAQVNALNNVKDDHDSKRKENRLTNRPQIWRFLGTHYVCRYILFEYIHVFRPYLYQSPPFPLIGLPLFLRKSCSLWVLIYWQLCVFFKTSLQFRVVFIQRICNWKLNGIKSLLSKHFLFNKFNVSFE